MKLRIKILHLNYISIISIIFILLQTCGIRFFQGIGSFLMILVILLNFKYLKRITMNSFVYYVISIFIFSVLQIIKDCSLLSTLNTILIITASYTFLLSYVDNSNRFIDELRLALKLLVFQAFVTIFAFFSLYYFKHLVQIGEMQYYTILNVFYYFIPNDGFPRNTGLFWEPGCLQFIANTLLFIYISSNYKLRKMLWVIAVIISTFSSAGFILLLINCLYYLIKNTNKLKIKYNIGLFIILSILIFPLIYEATYNKWTVNMSGMIRQVNTIAGVKLSFMHPFIGVDVNNLMNSLEFNKIEEDFWGINSSMISYNFGIVAGGFTNGFLAIFLTWGLFIGIFFYYLFFKSKFFPTSQYALFFLLLFIVANMTEALTNTSFFYVFVISTFVLGRRVTNKKIQNI